MAPSMMNRTVNLRISAFTLAALSLTTMTAPAASQTVYREYDDGRVETFNGDERDLSTAPLRRPPPRAFDEDEDERFERDDAGDDFDDDDQDDGETGDDRQGTLDLAPQTARKAPAPPPSVDAKPSERSWKPAL